MSNAANEWAAKNLKPVSVLDSDYQGKALAYN